MNEPCRGGGMCPSLFLLRYLWNFPFVSFRLVKAVGLFSQKQQHQSQNKTRKQQQRRFICIGMWSSLSLKTFLFFLSLSIFFFFLNFLSYWLFSPVVFLFLFFYFVLFNFPCVVPSFVAINPY